MWILYDSGFEYKHLKHLSFFTVFFKLNMSNYNLKKKKITSSNDHHTSYNIVDVCKQTIVNGDKNLHWKLIKLVHTYFD